MRNAQGATALRGERNAACTERHTSRRTCHGAQKRKGGPKPAFLFHLGLPDQKVTVAPRVMKRPMES